MSVGEDFYIIAREPGAEHPAIPTWANRNANPAMLESERDSPVTRVDIDTVPGAFQLLDLLSADECARLVTLTESLGYLADAAVSLPRSVRHNHNATWVADDVTVELLWQRCKKQFRNTDDFDAKRALGLNARFRFYRYGEGDYFAAHTDGSWPGSRVVDGKLVANAYDDRWSQLTFLLYLSDGFEGGETQFQVHSGHGTVDLRTPLGGALCFPHGMHPLHCVHASAPVTRGVKYIIRSDVLFEL